MISAPSVESTALAWICAVPNGDVNTVARAHRIPLSTRYYRSLAVMQRLAYALGTVLERMPARGTRRPDAPRALLWCTVRGDPENPRWATLWGVEPHSGRVLMRPNMLASLDDDTECTGLGAGETMEGLIEAYADGGLVLKPCTWLVPANIP